MDLCNACEKGDLEGVIKSLQANLENIHKLVGKHRVQCTALHYAAEYGHLDIVKELLAVRPLFKLSFFNLEYRIIRGTDLFY